jgi:hypothetical protein
MSNQDADDRREYYRIEDTIALDFSLLSGADAHSSDPLHDNSPLFNLLSELHLMDFESQHLLRHITERDRTLANYLKVMNKRIDLLGQAVAQSLLRDIGAPRRVSISEGGISFNHGKAIATGSHLALKVVLMPQALGLLLRAQVKVVLMPQALGLLLRAQVVHCQVREDGQFEIGTEFEALTDAQRQLLARHILQKQALERRQARGEE